MKLNVVFRPSLDPPLLNSDSQPSSSSSSSLFARLDPYVVHELYQQALRDIISDKPSVLATENKIPVVIDEINNSKSNSYWTITKNGNQIYDNDQVMIEFLPLAVTPFIQNYGNEDENDIQISTIYVSYNGGNIYLQQNQKNSVQNSHDEVLLLSRSSIELHPSLVPKGTKEVLVTPLTHVFNAVSVEVEPLTVSEWEIIECHALFLENGGLLNQISIVYPNQILELKLPARLGGTDYSSNDLNNSISSTNTSRYNLHDCDHNVIHVRVKVLPNSFLKSNYYNDLSEHEFETFHDDDNSFSDKASSSSSSSYCDLSLSSNDDYDDNLFWKRQNDKDDDISYIYQGHEALCKQKKKSNKKAYVPCLRLVENTKFLIAPKARSQSTNPNVQDFPPSSPIRVGLNYTFGQSIQYAQNNNDPIYIDSWDDISSSMLELYNMASSHGLLPQNGNTNSKISKQEYNELNNVPNLNEMNKKFQTKNIPPGCVILHPETLSQFVPGWKIMCQDQKPNKSSHKINSSTSEIYAVLWQHQINKHSDDHQTSQKGNSNEFTENKAQYKAIVRVLCSRNIERGHIVMTSMLRIQLNITPLYSHARIKLLSKMQYHRLYSEGCNHKSNDSILIEPIQMVDDQSPIPLWYLPQGSESQTIRQSQELSTSSTLDTNDVLRLFKNLLNEEQCNLPLVSGSLLKFNIEGADEYIILKITLLLHLNDSACDDNNRMDSVSVASEDRNYPSFLYLQDIVQIMENSSFGGIERKYLKLQCPSSNRFMNHLPDIPLDPHCFHAIIKKSMDLLFLRHQTLNNSEMTFLSGPNFHDGIILYGDEGTGKTHIVQTIAAILRLSLGYSSIYLDCKALQMMEPTMQSILDTITEIFQNAIFNAPSIIIFDNLDALTPNFEYKNAGMGESSSLEQGVSPELIRQGKLISDHMQYLQDDANSGHASAGSCILSYICTCKEENSLEQTLRSYHRFHTKMKIPSLNATYRSQLLNLKLSRSKNGIINCGNNKVNDIDKLTFSDDFLFEFERKSEGYRPRDILILSSRIRQKMYLKTLGRDNEVGMNEEVLKANSIEKYLIHELNHYVPISLKNATLSHAVTKWEKIAGLFRAKKILVESILHPVRFRKIYEQAPIKLPRGILLFGPSGCGKSYLVPALANECNLNLITCKGPELLDKFIGASEAKVRQLFRRAASASPSLLFFDEFEALAPRRGSDNTGVTDRIVNQLLTFLDGVEGLSKTDQNDAESSVVYIIAATSRPDRIDPALLRPGRLEKHIYIGYPENKEERNDIFNSLAEDRFLSSSASESVKSGELNHLLQMMYDKEKLFSAVDLRSVFDSAYLLAIKDYQKGEHTESKSDYQNDENEVPCINISHLKQALFDLKPSLSRSDYLLLHQLYKPFLSEDVKYAISHSLNFTQENTSTQYSSILKTALR